MLIFCMKDNNTNTSININTTSMTHQSSAESHDQVDQEMKKQQQHDETNTKTPLHMDIALQDVKELGTIVEAEDSGREKLKRHRIEVAGRVWIPDIWGQEEFLKDWIDCTKFDPPLVSANKIVTARTALVKEATASSAGFRFQCS